MPTRAEVIASKIQQYDAQITDIENANVELAMSRLAIAQTINSAGGGGGGGGTTVQTIVDGINTATDIDTIIARLTTIAATAQLTTADITNGINNSTDIDAIITALSTIRDRTPSIGAGTIATSQPVSIASDQTVLARVVSTATPVAQTTITLIAGGTDSYAIPSNARSFTICITSNSLVHYTEDGTLPTVNSCWFAGGSKEIWDLQVPASSTIRFLSVSAATISIQVRV